MFSGRTVVDKAMKNGSFVREIFDPSTDALKKKIVINSRGIKSIFPEENIGAIDALGKNLAKDLSVKVPHGPLARKKGHWLMRNIRGEKIQDKQWDELLTMRDGTPMKLSESRKSFLNDLGEDVFSRRDVFRHSNRSYDRARDVEWGDLTILDHEANKYQRFSTSNSRVNMTPSETFDEIPNWLKLPYKPM